MKRLGATEWWKKKQMRLTDLLFRKVKWKIFAKSNYIRETTTLRIQKWSWTDHCVCRRFSFKEATPKLKKKIQRKIVSNLSWLQFKPSTVQDYEQYAYVSSNEDQNLKTAEVLAGPFKLETLRKMINSPKTIYNNSPLTTFSSRNKDT